MFKTKSIKNFLCIVVAFCLATIWGIVCIGINPNKTYAMEECENFNVVYSKVEEANRIELKNVQTAHSKNVKNDSTEKLNSLINEYELNTVMVAKSNQIIIQEDNIAIDENDEDYINSVDSNESSSEIDTYGDSENPDFSSSSQDRIMKFTVIAYQVGTTERGNKIFCVEAKVTSGGYTTNKEDYFIIYGDSQTSFNSNYVDQMSGSYIYKRYYKRSNKTLLGSSTVTKNCTSNFGVVYSFKTPTKFASRIAVIKGQQAKGNYYLTAINDCSVSVVYVHNVSSKVNLSISVGPVGISVDTTKYIDYRATVLSLYK